MLLYPFCFVTGRTTRHFQRLIIPKHAISVLSFGIGKWWQHEKPLRRRRKYQVVCFLISKHVFGLSKYAAGGPYSLTFPSQHVEMTLGKILIFCPTTLLAHPCWAGFFSLSTERYYHWNSGSRPEMRFPHWQHMMYWNRISKKGRLDMRKNLNYSTHCLKKELFASHLERKKKGGGDERQWISIYITASEK